MASSKIKRCDIQKKLNNLRIEHKETENTIEKLNKGLIHQNKLKAEYEGAIIVLHELLTGKKIN